MKRAANAGLFLLAAFSCVQLPSGPRGSVSYWGFAAPWDPRSLASIREHGSQLGVVVSGWIALDSTSFRPVELYPDSTASGDGLAARYALITSFQGDRFHPEILRGLAGDARALGQTAGGIGSLVESGKYRGVVIDFEAMTVRDLDALLSVTRSVTDSCRAHGAATVVVAVPAGDTAGYPGALLLAGADYLMPMLYDEHWSGSAPGPIAEPDWALRYLGARVAEVGATKVIAAFPVYGYRWRSNAPAEVVSYADARRLAQATNTSLARDPASGSLHAVSPQGWEIWLSDSALLDSLVRQSRRIGVSTFALWRLGLEDRAVWTALPGH